MATPTSLIRNFSQEFDRFFNEPALRARWALPTLWAEPGANVQWLPDLEVERRDDAFVVRADLPGMARKDVTVQMEGDRIVLEGERKTEAKEQRDGFYRTERAFGNFRRTVALPEGADADAARATFKDGVLTITVPVQKAVEPEPRQLTIN